MDAGNVEGSKRRRGEVAAVDADQRSDIRRSDADTEQRDGSIAAENRRRNIGERAVSADTDQNVDVRLKQRFRDGCSRRRNRSGRNTRDIRPGSGRGGFGSKAAVKNQDVGESAC